MVLQFISSLPDFDDDYVAISLWEQLRDNFSDKEGVCYYKHPVLGTRSGIMADLTFFTKTTQPTAIHSLNYTIDDILSIEEDYWVVKDDFQQDSPILKLEDFVIELDGLVRKDRKLRRRLSPKGILALPLISEHDFRCKFSAFAPDFDIIWSGTRIEDVIHPLQNKLSEDEWRSFRAVIQTATPLSVPSRELRRDTTRTLSAAIRELDRQIKTLDLEQEKVSIQIPPGPQRIRGLAGTGKTVLLAMRAANIHRHYPEKKILFTFHTQSLYNLSRRLIADFYGVHQGNTEPDWSKIHVRHAWGGRNRAGVYSDICSKNGVNPLSLRNARYENRTNPFQACCKHALGMQISPVYDYLIVDEAQDFPQEFFEVLYQLSKTPHCIYWAYDQLQSLAESSLSIPGPEDLFGTDAMGNPRVTFDDQDYPGGIQKDFVLSKSYRCPQDVLMLAHAIGLGLYNPKGCVQMLESKDSWSAIGYEVEGDADWIVGAPIELFRPPENSPNRISHIYNGNQDLIMVNDFQTRGEEFDWVAYSIDKDINEEGVAPEHIVVIVLDALSNKRFSAQIQMRLVQFDVASTIPGVAHDTDAYAEEGRVTISSVFRAKGNEAYIVYIVGFEELYNYVDAIENRNRAFTAISRSKAWVRISGIGEGMNKAKHEIDRILRDIPRFHFKFPEMENLRNLDVVTQKRRKKRQRGNKRIEEFIKDPELLQAANPDLLKRLRELLAEQGSEY